MRRSPKQQAALDRLLEEQQTPGSPNYHRWLTSAQFAERFGPPASLVRRVEDWLRSEGFAVGPQPGGRGWVPFRGTAGQVARTFRSQIHRYAEGARTYFAAQSDFAIPAEFDESVRAIRGLDNRSWTANPRFVPLYTAGDGTHALAPQDLVTIYGRTGLQQAGTGKDQRVVVVGQSAIVPTDISHFRELFQLPANAPELLLIGDDPGIDRSGALQEAEADIEWVGGLAPEAHIIYVYATDALDAAQAAIDRNLAPVLSFSFGACEASLSAEGAAALRDLAQQANAQGITWVAASGDAGPAACDERAGVASHGLSVSAPASLPEVTGVGGTEFDEGQAANLWGGNYSGYGSAYRYIPEKAWNGTSEANGLRASGGGTSVYYPKPAWQSGPGVPADQGRNVPDISISASPDHDPYLVVIDNSLYGFGGTSIGAPVLAGMLAVTNELQQEKNGTTGLGNINLWLYDHARQKFGFHDITAGNNVVPCATGSPDCTDGSLGFQAGPGYDRVTGLGSPDGFPVIGLLSSTTTMQVSRTQVMYGETIELTVRVTADDRVSSIASSVPAGGVAVQTEATDYVGNSATLDSSGSATITAKIAINPGSHQITAHYGGDSRFGESNSAPVTIIVLPPPPVAPVLYWPPNGATGVPLNLRLGAGVAGDLYLGTTNPPPLWGSTADLVLGLTPNTKYYWKLVARNASGSAESPIWSFTTTGGAYDLTRIAGIGKKEFSGDGGRATVAGLNWPTQLAVDHLGKIYIADCGNSRVRVVAPDGTISTLAGTGSDIISGDGGPALAAGLGCMTGIAVDPAENVFISTGHQIRKIAPNGTISTVAGTGSEGSSGDGGPATAAQLSRPSGLAVDSDGSLYIADTGNDCIRKISAGKISTVAGQCASSSMRYPYDGGPATENVLGSPLGVSVDSAGRIYVADGTRVRKIEDGIINTIAGGADPLMADPSRYDLDQAGSAMILRGVRGICADNSGSVFFSDSDGSRAAFSRFYKWTGGIVSVVAGSGQEVFSGTTDRLPATTASIVLPLGCAVGAGGAVYLPDAYSSVVGLLTPAVPASAPAIASGGIVNAASMRGGAVAPGSIATAFGSFGAVAQSAASEVPLPKALAGIALQFPALNGITVPLFFVSPGQVNFQVPWEAAGQASAAIGAVRHGENGPMQTLSVAPFAPGIFTANGQGTLQGVVVDLANRLVDSTNPASSGSVVQIYCTGLGAVSNPPETGEPASTTALSPTVAPVTVTIGGKTATVLFAGLAPGAIGEYQVNVQIPENVAPGLAVPLSLSVGGGVSNTVTIAVQ